MLKPKTKVIEAGGKSYQLTKLDARSASYVAMKAACVIAPSAGLNANGIAAAISGMSRAEFDEMQTLLLKTVRRLVDAPNGQQLPEPVLTAKGDFVDDALAYDGATVIRLTVEALMFNVGDFFGEAGLKAPAQ